MMKVADKKPYIFAAVLIVIAVISMAFLMPRENARAGITISFPGGVSVEENLWQDEDGTQYLFVPGSAEVSDPEGLASDAEQIVLSPIPCVFLTTESGNLDYLSLDRENRESGTAYVLDENGMTEYGGELESVHLRGFSSFWVDKKSFVLELPDERNLLGLGRSDKWYLLAQYQDDTKVRIQLINTYISQNTDLKYIEFKYADVFVNGEYYGLFLIGRNKSADVFGITDLELLNREADSNYRKDELLPLVSEDDSIHAFSLNREPRDITGGYVLEIILGPELYDAAYPAFTSSRGFQYYVKNPDNASYEEVAYIKSVIDELEAAVYSPDGVNLDTGKRYSDYIDINDWAEYYLVKEGFMDVDVLGNISVYMWKDSDSYDPKIHMGPVWDMDRSLGVEMDNRYSYLSDPDYLVSDLIFADRMLEFPEVREEICNLLESGYLDWCENEPEGILEDLYGTMHFSHDADRIRWIPYGLYDLLDTEAGNSRMMVDFLKRRASFLRSHYLEGDSMHRIYLYDNGMPAGQFMVRDGDTLGNLPRRYSYTDIFVGWNMIDGSGAPSPEMAVTEDMEFQAVWISVGLLAECDTDTVLGIIKNTDIVMLDLNDLYGFRDTLSELQME